jgi:lactam utilization protein B
MGFIKNVFSRNGVSRLSKLPSGSFAVDRDGRLVVTTLPGSFPEAQMKEIGQRVLAFFRGAEIAQVPVQELNVYYSSLKVTARNLRGGAIVFLSPQTLPKN